MSIVPNEIIPYAFAFIFLIFQDHYSGCLFHNTFCIRICKSIFNEVLISIHFASWDDVKSNRESTVQHTHDSCQKLEPGSVLLRTARSATYANEKGSPTDTLTKDISGRLDHSNWYIILSLIILDLILDHSFLSFRHYFLHTNVCFNITHYSLPKHRACWASTNS